MTRVILRRDGYRNLLRLNSTVTAQHHAPWTEHRFYINELPQFVDVYQATDCNSVGQAKLDALPLVFDRSLLPQGVRCLLLVVNEQKIQTSVVSTTTPPPPGIYSFEDGLVDTIDQTVKVDNVTVRASVGFAGWQSGGGGSSGGEVGAPSSPFLPTVDLSVPNAILESAEQAVLGLKLVYSAIDASLQNFSPAKATIDITIPSRELAFPSAYWEWSEHSVEGYKYCAPWEEAVPQALGFSSPNACKQACDDFGLENPLTKYGYSPSGNATKNYALNPIPSCVAVTYFSAENPYVEPLVGMTVAEFRNATVDMSYAENLAGNLTLVEDDSGALDPVDGSAFSYLVDDRSGGSASGGSARIPFYVSGETPSVTVSLLVKGGSAASDAVRIAVDGGSAATVSFGAPYNVWKWKTSVSLGTLTRGFHNLTIKESDRQSRIGKVRLEGSEGAFFPYPSKTSIFEDSFNYTADFAALQSAEYRQVRCYLHTKPCSSTPFSSAGGVVFKKRLSGGTIERSADNSRLSAGLPASSAAAGPNATVLQLNWGQNPLGFDFLIRRVPMLWENTTDAEITYCGGVGACDSTSVAASPLAYKAEQYR